jgi:outer membrane lipoprotein-sorting protein
MSSREQLHPAGPDLSAWLDGELNASEALVVEEHLQTCDECARTIEELGAVRRIVRAQPAGDVPDLVEEILSEVEYESRPEHEAPRSEWRVRARLASISAVAAAALLFGVVLQTDDTPSQVALASQIAEKVRSEARSVDAYRATFNIVERGWDERVGTRRFSAEVSFEAPESYRLTITDDTDYPNPRWPANDVELIAGPKSWWIKEPSSCPPESLPACAGRGTAIQTRSHVQREPFDGTVGLPTDLVLPLKTLADDPTWEVLGREEVVDRTAFRISLSYRQAVPLVEALQAGGLWRSFYATDPVSLWIDEETGVPLKFRVTASDSYERRIWANRLGYEDRPGLVLLQATAGDFSQPKRFAPATFDAPDSLLKSSGRFQGAPFSGVSTGITPERVAGLKRSRAGFSGVQRIISYAQGMAWLKISGAPLGTTPATGDPRSEEIRLRNDSFAYYLPATSDRGRVIEIFGDTTQIRIETNLPSSTARRVASSIEIEGERLEGNEVSRSSFAMKRVSPEALENLRFVRTPSYMPEGYTARAAYKSKRSTGRSATVYYRGAESEWDGLGIRITQESGVDLLPPSPEEGVSLTSGGLDVRWFPERNEIDWISGGVYRSIAAPSFSRSTLLRIVHGLK